MWILVVILSLVFVVSAVSNAMIWLAFLFKKKTGSTVPILGALAGMLAVFLAPVDGVRSFWWVPLVIDPGGLLWCVFLIRGLIRRPTRESS